MEVICGFPVKGVRVYGDREVVVKWDTKKMFDPLDSLNYVACKTLNISCLGKGC